MNKNDILIQLEKIGENAKIVGFNEDKGFILAQSELVKNLDIGKYGYNLDLDFFDKVLEEVEPHLIDDVEKKTILELGGMSDWWVSSKDDKPKMTIIEVINFALSILNCEMTKFFMRTMYIESIPEIEVPEIESFPVISFRGSKRVHCLPIKAYENESYIDPLVISDLFIFYGKEESCCVEGSWLDWVCFAGNVLSSDFVKTYLTDIYKENLKNDNY